MDQSLNVIQASSSLLCSWDYSDFIVRCGNEEFKVHKAIVCPQSSFFRAAVNGEFKESRESLVVLHDDDLHSIKRMLDFMYKSTFSPEKESVNDSNVDVILAEYGALYIVADKYDVEDLRRKTMRRIQHIFKETKVLSDECANLLSISEFIGTLIGRISKDDPLVKTMGEILAERFCDIDRKHASRNKDTSASSFQIHKNSEFQEILDASPTFANHLIEAIRTLHRTTTRTHAYQKRQLKNAISKLETILAGPEEEQHLAVGWCVECEEFKVMEVKSRLYNDETSSLFPDFDVVCQGCGESHLEGIGYTSE